MLLSMFAFAYAQTTFFQTKDAFMTSFMQSIISQWELQAGRKEVVKRFCTTALKQWLVYVDAWETADNTLIYDPRQSIFLRLLCTHINSVDVEEFTKWVEKDYLKIESLKDLNLMCESRNAKGDYFPKWCVRGCTADSYDMNSCDFALLLPKFVSLIMNDYSNQALSLAYGVWETADTADIDVTANEMFFKRGDAILYNDRFPEYPKTHNHLKQYIKQIRKTQANSNILDTKKIIETWSKKKASDCNNESLQDGSQKILQPITYDLHACPYSNAAQFSQNRTQLWGIVHVMYNENYWYQLFAQYYAYMLRNDMSLHEFQTTTNITKTRMLWEAEAQNMIQEAQLTQQALESTQQMVSNIQATFPIHIWLVLYHEAAKSFRDSFAKTYTPIHQLYYKLQDHQAKTY